MDFKQIQELIKLINKSNIGEVTIEEKHSLASFDVHRPPTARLSAARQFLIADQTFDIGTNTSLVAAPLSAATPTTPARSVTMKPYRCAAFAIIEPTTTIVES